MTSPMTTCPACGATLVHSIDYFCPNTVDKSCIYNGSFDGEATRLKTTVIADPNHVSTAAYIMREWQEGRRPKASLEDVAAEIVEKTAGRTVRRYERVPANLAEARAHWEQTKGKGA